MDWKWLKVKPTPPWVLAVCHSNPHGHTHGTWNMPTRPHRHLQCTILDTLFIYKCIETQICRSILTWTYTYTLLLSSQCNVNLSTEFFYIVIYKKTFKVKLKYRWYLYHFALELCEGCYITTKEDYFESWNSI